MMRLSALTTSFRALSVVQRPASLARIAVAPMAARALHATAAPLDMATGADVVLESPPADAANVKKPRAPRKKAVDGAAGSDAPAKARKPRATKAAEAGSGTESAKKPKKAAAPEKEKTAAEKKPKKVAKKATPKKPKRILTPPKRISNTWLLFYKERLNAMDKSEKHKVTDLSRSLVSEFRGLSDDERRALEDRLKEHHEQYEKDMQAFLDTITPEQIAAENVYRRAQNKTTKKKKRPLLRDPTAPVPPRNGFIRYTQYVRSNPDVSEKVLGARDAGSIPVTEAAIALASGWKSLPEAEREEYQEAYRKEKEVYERELADWKAKAATGEAGATDAAAKASAEPLQKEVTAEP